MKNKNANVKYFILSFVVLTTLILTTSSCKKNGSNATLPAITQTGANTFGCLINGNVFVPAGNNYSGPNLHATYQFEYVSPDSTRPTGFVFALSGTDKSNTCNITSIGIEFDSVFLGVGQYILKAPKIGGGFGYYLNNSCNGPSIDSTTSDLLTGQLNITRFDMTNQIVSGTFSFDVKDNNGNIMHITQGRFDTHFVL